MEDTQKVQQQDIQSQLRQVLAELEAIKSARLCEDRQAETPVVATNVAKPRGAGKPDPNRKYVLLSKTLNMFGRVPRQQEELGRLISANFEVGQQIPETELFATIEANAGQYHSLASSRQEPTYLFRYYRGLDKKNGKHLGFVQRGFLKSFDLAPASPLPTPATLVEVPAEFVG